MSKPLQFDLLPRRPHADRRWAIGILLSGIFLGVGGFWIGSVNQRAAQMALEVSPESVYFGEFTLRTRDGLTSTGVNDMPVLVDFFASLASGESVSRIATRDFAIQLSGSVYSREGKEIRFACVANEREGPWFAVVENVLEIRVKDDRAVQRVLAEVKENQYSSALRRIAVSPTGGKHGAPDSANVE